MATIEISQASVPVSQPGTRYDLIPREAIICTASDPVPGAGVSYVWEILDAAGSAAVLDATTGSVVNIGVGGADINPYCAFKLRLIATDNGDVTESIISVGVPHPLGLMDEWGSPNASRYIVPEMFAETSAADGTITTHDATLSTDNMLRELADTGVSTANWRGWSTKDYDAKKRLLDQTFAQGWETEIIREDDDAGPHAIQLFDMRLLDMHQYFPVEMWGMQPTFEVEIVGTADYGHPVNIRARIQFNLVRAYYEDNGGNDPSIYSDGVTITYEEYDVLEIPPTLDPPETVLTPNAPTGPTYLYEGDGTQPDSYYLLPYMHRVAQDDWHIALKVVTDDMAAPHYPETRLRLKVRVKPLMAAPDSTGYVDPDFSGPALPAPPPS